MSTLAVCSWSLRPESPADLVEKVRACGLSAVQLALEPVRTWQWRPDETGSLLRTSGIRAVSGMLATKDEDYSTLESIKATGGLRPDQHWEANLRAADGCAIFAARYAIPLVTFHAGFLPHDPADPERARMIERLRAIADVFAARGVSLALETGQEDADTLSAVLDELNSGLAEKARIGVNFDPANMILYGMGDPIAALNKLMPHVRQIHIKDAVPATKPGTWGEEKRMGDGAVDWPAFMAVLKKASYTGPLVIEREAGESRVEDVAHAVGLLRSFLN